ncbi:MAG: TIGR03618 family F420-dependent PPOX class oxidoreductase [Alphaproteobacteria bacterium]|nr:TIGR03618 family F420-dependent PPOX class oxidoreductase [Alphaproteobacteria bacterium]
MEISEVQKFLESNHRGVLVAYKRDGSPQMTLVTPAVDAEGHVVISARGNTFKVKNIRRNPNVSMLVMGEEFYKSAYYQLDGKAEIIGLPESEELLMTAYRRRLGDSLDETQTRQKILDEDRVIIRITIDRVGPQSGR